MTSIRPGWRVESGPVVMKQEARKASTTARASRLCARPGDKFKRMKCCSSGTTAAIFTIGATFRSARNTRHRAGTVRHACPKAARRQFCPLGSPDDKQNKHATCEKVG